MARALIAGCGCRGRMLGAELLAGGWQVRAGSRSARRRQLAEAEGLEPAAIDPARLDTVLERVGDVTVVVWPMGSAQGEEVPELHGGRLRRLLERLVDTPVRGFVYEGAGTVAAELLAGGGRIVEAAGSRFRIPVAVTRIDPGDRTAWLREMESAVVELVQI